jgi:ABC-2 type transport system permease protein
MLAALGAALFGLAPRALPLVWVALASFAVVGVFGEVFDLPGWVLAISPFEHVDEVPVVAPTAAALLVPVLVAVALVAAGQAGFRRRDLATA